MKFSEILDDCIGRLRQGESLEACLARYPQQRQDLEPLLRVAAQLHQAPRPRLSMVSRGLMRERLHGVLDDQRARSQRSLWNRLFPLRMRAPAFVLAVFLAMVLVAAGLTTAATDSLPGDTFYAVKRAQEDVLLALTRSSASRARLRLSRLETRLVEMEALGSQGREYTPVVLAALQNETQVTLTAIAEGGGGKVDTTRLLLGQFLAFARKAQALLAEAVKRTSDVTLQALLETTSNQVAHSEAWAITLLSEPDLLESYIEGMPLPSYLPPTPSPTATVTPEPTATPTQEPTTTPTVTETPSMTATPTPRTSTLSPRIPRSHADST